MSGAEGKECTWEKPRECYEFRCAFHQWVTQQRKMGEGMNKIGGDSHQSMRWEMAKIWAKAGWMEEGRL